MVDDERIAFTDEDSAFLRHARFGELPPRVLPEELTELVESEGRRDGPDPVPADVLWFGYYNV